MISALYHGKTKNFVTLSEDNMSAQSDQRLSHSLCRKYINCIWYTQNFKVLASLCSGAGWFKHALFANHEDKFPRDGAHILYTFYFLLPIDSTHGIWSAFRGLESA